MTAARHRARLSRALVGTVFALVAVAGAGCGGDDSGDNAKQTSKPPIPRAPASKPPTRKPPKLATTPRIVAADFSFGPRITRVRAGQTITWTNSGQTEHTIKGSGFFSKALEPGQRFRHRFSKPGPYPYVCTLHPDRMRGVVLVTAR